MICIIFVALIFFFHGKSLTQSQYQPTQIEKQSIDPNALKSRLSQLPEERLIKMAKAAEKLQILHGLFEKEEMTPLDFLISPERGHYLMNHYPKRDVIDSGNQSQYYFHSHREGECGHFHLFLYEPLPLQQTTKDPFAHLVAISVDEKGNPIKLFITNQWVTEEYTYPYNTLCKMIDHFKIEKLKPSWALNDWINQIVVLFYPQIIDLMQRRSEIEQVMWKDRSREILAETPISLELQIEKLKELTP